MEFAVVTIPAAPVRRKARHKAEMVNQLLFGDMVKVLKTKDNKWLKVRSLYDDYEGWLTQHMLSPVDKATAKDSHTQVSTSLLAKAELYEHPLHIPAGSSLWLLGKTETQFRFSGSSWDISKIVPTSEMVIQLSMEWLNAPYLWGGRTVLGVDCSGFAQVIFKLMGIRLPRDAWQQAQKGQAVKRLKDALTGDLAFFDDKDEIVHVGILLGNDKIVHASGKVRIDSIDKDGIIQAETGERTHKLRAIRRFW